MKHTITKLLEFQNVYVAPSFALITAAIDLTWTKPDDQCQQYLASRIEQLGKSDRTI